MTNSLQQMSQRREAWLNEKPGFSGGNELRLRTGDEVYAHFVSSAGSNNDDGDRFIKLYRAHSFDVIGSNGKRSNPVRYCMIQNGDAPECAYCQMGHDNIKERMSMWFYVYFISHRTMPANTPPEKMLPMFQDSDGIMKYKEDVNDFRVWHSSAWRESPWADIVKLADMYKGLNNFVAQIGASGEGMQRRYKLWAMPEPRPFGPEGYAKAQELTPIPQLLKEQLASTVAWNPQAAQPQAMQQQVQQPQANNIIPFNPVSAFGATTPAAPAATPAFAFQAPAAPQATAPPPVPAPVAPPAPPAPVEEPATEAPTPPWVEPEAEAPAAPVAEQPAPTPPAPVAPAGNAPLKKLF